LPILYPFFLFFSAAPVYVCFVQGLRLLQQLKFFLCYTQAHMNTVISALFASFAHPKKICPPLPPLRQQNQDTPLLDTPSASVISRVTQKNTPNPRLLFQLPLDQNPPPPPPSPTPPPPNPPPPPPSHLTFPPNSNCLSGKFFYIPLPASIRKPLRANSFHALLPPPHRSFPSCRQQNLDFLFELGINPKSPPIVVPCPEPPPFCRVEESPFLPSASKPRMPPPLNRLSRYSSQLAPPGSLLAKQDIPPFPPLPISSSCLFLSRPSQTNFLPPFEPLRFLAPRLFSLFNHNTCY